MKHLTNSEIAYNNLLEKVKQIIYYIQTSSEELDENYYNKLVLNAKINSNEDALKQCNIIDEINSMKEEQAKLLDYDENGELNIQKYELNEYSKIYVLSEYLDIKELLKIENHEYRFTKIKKLGVPENEIARVLCDEKNENFREFILTTKIEDDNGKLLPAVNMIFEDKENVKKLLFSAKNYSKAIAENIINGEYGDLSQEEANLVILNSGESHIQEILKESNLFARQE